jgi:homoserine kinase
MASRIEVKRFKAEDFPADDQELVERIGDVYNNFADNVAQAINGGLNIDNLQEEIRTIEVEVNAAGTPTVNLDLTFSKLSRINGILVLRAQAVNSTTTFATGAPFVSFVQTGSRKITIQNITGLPANTKFQLTLRLV